MNSQYIIKQIKYYKENGIPLWLKASFFLSFSSIITMILLLFTTTLFAKNLTTETFGYISSYRRLCNLLTAIITGGFLIGIPRYIAFYKNDSVLKLQMCIFASISVTFSGYILIVLNMFIFNEHISRYLDWQYSSIDLVLCLTLLLFSLITESIIYSITQGYENIVRGNALHIVSLGIIPLVIALYASSRITAVELLLYIAISRLIFLLPIILYLYFKSIKTIWRNFFQLIKVAIEFLKYSLLRTIGGFGMMGIVSIGPILAVVLLTPVEAAYLEISQVIISLIAGVSLGINVGLLTHISKLSNSSNKDEINKKILITEKIALFIGIYLAFQIILFADDLILLWLGDLYLPALRIIQISSLSIIPYTYYTFLRGPIDASNVQPINAINTVIALIIIVMLSILMTKLGVGIYGIVISLLIGYFVLGILTLIYVHKTFNFTFKLIGFNKILLINLGIFLFVALEKVLIENLLVIILLNSICLLLYWVRIAKKFKTIV